MAWHYLLPAKRERFHNEMPKWLNIIYVALLTSPQMTIYVWCRRNTPKSIKNVIDRYTVCYAFCSSCIFSCDTAVSFTICHDAPMQHRL